MKHLLKPLFFIALVLAFALPGAYAAPGLALISCAGAMLLALAIRHRTIRQEGAALILPGTAFFWIGSVYFFPHDFGMALVAFLFFGAGVMSLIMMVCSYWWNGGSDEIKQEESMLVAIIRSFKTDFSQSADDFKHYKWTGKRVLQIMLWLCVFASAAVMILAFTAYALWIALALSLSAIALTFAYEASSVGRVRSTYGAFASLCLIGVLGPMALGPIPLIFLVMLAVMALLTRED